MRQFLWITVGLTFLFSLLYIVPIAIFNVKQKISNKLDKDIYVTPFGRERSPDTSLVPLSFHYPQMTNPFNKDILIKSGETITIEYDNDACLVDGVIFKYLDKYYSQSAFDSINGLNITKQALNNTLNLKLANLTSKKATGFSRFLFQLFALIYWPLMTIALLVKKNYR